MHFVSIDVETANSNMGTICQIGFVEFSDGVEIGATSIYIDPEDYFDSVNVAVHGITPEHVIGAPTFSAHHPTLTRLLGERLLVCHTHFDRVAFRQACDLNKMAHLSNAWLDSARIARRTWPDVARSGYGLKPLADRLGLQLDHHDAVSDARCAGQIALHACKETGLSLEQWLVRVEQSLSGEPYVKTKAQKETYARAGDWDGPFAGETVVFTGRLTIVRRDAADIAHAAGASVADLVTKKTTILVVGDQDAFRLAGHMKSDKHRKADALIAKGQPIRIFRQSDFLQMTGNA